MGFTRPGFLNVHHSSDDGERTAKGLGDAAWVLWLLDSISHSSFRRRQHATAWLHCHVKNDTFAKAPQTTRLG